MIETRQSPGLSASTCGVSCSCLTRISNSIDRAGASGNGTPPIGISAFASQNWVSSRYYHRARSYAALGDSAGGILARMAHGLRERKCETRIYF